MITKIINYIKAGYAGLFMVSAEEERVDADMQRIALDAVIGVQELPDNAIVLFHDIHLYLEDVDPVLLRVIRTTLKRAKSTGQVIIFTGCRSVIPRS